MQDSNDEKLSLDDLYTDDDNYDPKIEFENILKLLKSERCSFTQIVERLKEVFNGLHNTDCKLEAVCLIDLMYNKKLFEEMTQSRLLHKEDLKYLLHTLCEFNSEISMYSENRFGDNFDCLCRNTPLIKYILSEFILDIETVKRFSPILENCDNSWSKENNIHTVFDLIAYYNKNNEEILELNELNRKVYLLNSFDLNEDERLELIEVLRDNEQSQNTLIQIIENHLLDQYDFESLKNLLTKDNDKTLKTKFNF